MHTVLGTAAECPRGALGCPPTGGRGHERGQPQSAYTPVPGELLALNRWLQLTRAFSFCCRACNQHIASSNVVPRVSCIPVGFYMAVPIGSVSIAPPFHHHHRTSRAPQDTSRRRHSSRRFGSFDQDLGAVGVVVCDGVMELKAALDEVPESIDRNKPLVCVLLAEGSVSSGKNYLCPTPSDKGVCVGPMHTDSHSRNLVSLSPSVFFSVLLCASSCLSSIRCWLGELFPFQ